MTWRAGQTVLGCCHLSVRVDGSRWTRVLVFGPGPGWTVMTHWTFISDWWRAIITGRTIKSVQTKTEKRGFGSVYIFVQYKEQVIYKYPKQYYTSSQHKLLSVDVAECVACKWFLPLGTGSAAGLAIVCADSSLGAKLRSRRSFRTVITWWCTDRSHDRAKPTQWHHGRQGSIAQVNITAARAKLCYSGKVFCWVCIELVFIFIMYTHTHTHICVYIYEYIILIP